MVCAFSGNGDGVSKAALIQFINLTGAPVAQKMSQEDCETQVTSAVTHSNHLSVLEPPGHLIHRKICEIGYNTTPVDIFC